MANELDVVLRLVLACLLGGIVGYERQAKHKAAGLRTHILVCLGSCLIMFLSISIWKTTIGLTKADPERLAAQVVSGIGFLGAGSILTQKRFITGLTTAASLWVVAGIGLAVGSGSFVSAVATTVLAFLTLRILSRFEAAVIGSDCLMELCVVTVNRPGQIGKISSSLGDMGIRIRDIRMESQEEQKNLSITFSLSLPPQLQPSDVLTNLMNIDGMEAVHHQ
ncbi:mgtc/sapb protein signature [Lucifera butyrica]|uniref:Mgtc/sapb protein signature n=1 Tax=Lucifera butyrica TaxID=1351585 RepID=A0A498R2R4_9FIRM|nr:MgtC/SapB family protein [Lucifera butyrica]VBB05445.1 mgtc/sapb protein signature [Lucifera butyrica]